MKTYQRVCATCKWLAICLFGENFLWFYSCPRCRRLHGCFLLFDGSITPRKYIERSCPEIVRYVETEELAGVLCDGCKAVEQRPGGKK